MLGYIKGVGGGPAQKYEKSRFLVIMIANFVYFHLLFTEFENSDPLTQNWRICRGGCGPRGGREGHFRPFCDIQWPKSQKKCEKMYFNELYINEYDTRNVPESEKRAFCHQPTSKGLPIIVIFSYRPLTPPNGHWSRKGYSGNFWKKKFHKNGPRLKLDPPRCNPDHLEWIYTNQ